MKAEKIITWCSKHHYEELSETCSNCRHSYEQGGYHYCKLLDEYVGEPVKMTNEAEYLTSMTCDLWQWEAN